MIDNKSSADASGEERKESSSNIDQNARTSSEIAKGTEADDEADESVANQDDDQDFEEKDVVVPHKQQTVGKSKKTNEELKATLGKKKTRRRPSVDAEEFGAEKMAEEQKSQKIKKPLGGKRKRETKISYK